MGVAGDAKYMEMREATHRTIYLNTFQESSVDSRFALRTSVDPEAVTPRTSRSYGARIPEDSLRQEL